jgi:hypothetical protein
MDGLMDGKIDRLFIVRSGQVSQSFQGGWRVWGERRVGLVGAHALQYVVYPCILKVQTTSKRLKEWRTFCVYRCICWCMPMHADVWVLIIGHCWPKWCSISCRLTRPFSPCVWRSWWEAVAPADLGAGSMVASGSSHSATQEAATPQARRIADTQSKYIMLGWLHKNSCLCLKCPLGRLAGRGSAKVTRYMYDFPKWIRMWGLWGLRGLWGLMF